MAVYNKHKFIFYSSGGVIIEMKITIPAVAPFTFRNAADIGELIDKYCTEHEEKLVRGQYQDDLDYWNKVKERAEHDVL